MKMKDLIFTVFRLYRVRLLFFVSKQEKFKLKSVKYAPTFKHENKNNYL